MSLLRFANVTRKSSSLLVNQSVTNALRTTVVLKRNFWSRWRRDGDNGKMKDDAKKKETEKKADGKQEKEKGKADKVPSSMFNSSGATEDALHRSTVIKKDLDILNKVRYSSVH